MAQIQINLGTYALDATGTVARLAFIACNAMFTELFARHGTQGQQVINVGTYSAGLDPANVLNTPVVPGDTSLVAFTKINANFAILFALTVSPGFQEVILMGGEPGMIIGQDAPVIGTGDPARVAWFKVNQNFTYLYAVL